MVYVKKRIKIKKIGFKLIQIKLPNAEIAVISRAKVENYLLSLEHRDGRGKAQFFLKYGFATHRWEELAAALQRHALENEVSKVEYTPFGTRYAIIGPLPTLNRESVEICSVWFIAKSETVPKFVTAYPERRKSA